MGFRKPYLLLLSLLSIVSGLNDDTKYVTLSNGLRMPKVGLGVGNMPNDAIADIIQQAMKDDLKYEILDTSRASRNEHIIANGLMKAFDQNEDEIPTQIITKVWYTHLGYERTKISVQESLDDLGDLSDVHVLLHWPRCYPSIPWMRCEEEENDLPDYVKHAGPSPLEDPAAWKGSWRALEELYHENDRIISIGVSNFIARDLQELVDEFDVKPHIYQGHLKDLFMEEGLFDILQENRITFQAYNVIHSTFFTLEDKPFARFHFERIANAISRADDPINWPRLVFGYLTQRNITLTVRSTNHIHLQENSPESVARVPILNEMQNIEMREILFYLLTGRDTPKPANYVPPNEQRRADNPPPVHATFMNKLMDAVDLFWVNNETGEHVLVANDFKPGAENSLSTFPGHSFVAKGRGGSFHHFIVDRFAEREAYFTIEL